MPNCYCYTYANRTHFLILSSVYITAAREGHTLAAQPDPTRETESRE